MNGIVIVEDDLKEYGIDICDLTNFRLFSYNDEIISDAQTVILIYKVDKGRYRASVEEILHQFEDKKIVLLGFGNSGFDVNRKLYLRFREKSNVIIYSKYFKRLNVSSLVADLENKIVATDGFSFSERFIGSLSRIIFGGYL